MTVGQLETDNKIYSDIRKFANEQTPINRFKSDLEQEYGKERFWNVMQELIENQETSIKLVKQGNKKPMKVLELRNINRNKCAYSLSVLDGKEVQRISIGAKTKISDIASIVCLYLGVNEDTLHHPSRKRELVQARQICMSFQRSYSKRSLKSIGRYWQRDHSTVIHAIKTVSDICETDKKFREEYNEINRLIINKL
jgi:hypothetical protein